ncbi:MAG: protein kinase domain-containing protein [Mycobacteriales bacterium]
MSPAAGEFVLSGRYRLVEPLATGGMGTVWRAYDDVLDRPVAVKEVLLPPRLDPEEREVLRRRTLREARAAAKLRHAAIVTIFDVIEHDDRPWIVMELVPSQSLDERIRRRGPLPPSEAAAIGLRILDALVTAQAAGVQHRDIKPANVLLADDGRVVLTDFGIARHVGDETLTSAGLLVGSPNFLAPERARGLESVGLQSDLWSLGATLYTAVEGHPPFERNGPLPTLTAVVMDEPPPPRHAGPLRAVIDGLLVKNPVHRLDADRTRAMLQRALRPGAAVAPPVVPVGPPPDPTRPLPQVEAGGADPSATAVVRRQGVRPPAAAGGAAASGTAGARLSGTAAGAAAEPAPAGTAAGGADAPRDTDTPSPPAAASPVASAPAAPASPAAPPSAVPSPAAPARTEAGAAEAPRDTGTLRPAAPVSGAAAPGTDGASRTGTGGPGAAAQAAPARTDTGARRAPRDAETPQPTAAGPPPPKAAATAAAAASAAASVDSGAAPSPARAAADRPASTRDGAAMADRRPAPVAAAASAGPAAPAAPAASRPSKPPAISLGRTDGRRRVVLLVAAAAVIATVLAALLLPQLIDRQNQAAPSPTTAPSPTAVPTDQGAATGTPAPTRTRPAPTTARPAPTTARPSAGSPPGAQIPAGFTRYRDPQDGFQLAVPDGWRPNRRGTLVDFDDPGSGRFLRIDTSDHPQADPYTNWIEYERSYRQGKTDYQNLGIRRVDYGADRGWRTADWEFRIGGTHVLDRNILVNSRRAHAIYWSTPESMWNTAESRRIFQVAAATFVPAPVD